MCACAHAARQTNGHAALHSQTPTARGENTVEYVRTLVEIAHGLKCCVALADADCTWREHAAECGIVHIIVCRCLFTCSCLCNYMCMYFLDSHIYIYIYTCTHTHTCISYIYIYIYILYVCISIYTYIYIYICGASYRFKKLWVEETAWLEARGQQTQTTTICVCISLSLSIYIYTHRYTCVYIHTYTHTHA